MELRSRSLRHTDHRSPGDRATETRGPTWEPLNTAWGGGGAWATASGATRASPHLKAS